jgi:hypothetical protein
MLAARDAVQLDLDDERAFVADNGVCQNTARYSARNGDQSHVKVLANARRPGEENRTASQPVSEISTSRTTGDVTACHCVANRCNDPLQVVASADPIAEELDLVRSAWLSDHDGR